MDCVICESCLIQLEEIKKKHDIITSEVDGEEISEADGLYYCLVCKNELSAGDKFYYEQTADEEFEAITQALADVLSQDIEACFNCEGSQIDGYIHAWNKDADNDEIKEKDVGSTITEFLSDREIPEDLHKKLTEHLKCQGCKYGGESPSHKDPSAGSFDLEDEVYTQKEIDQFWGYYFDYEEFSKFASGYGIEFYPKEMEGFREYISKNPLLAFKHEAGKKLYDLLRKHYEEKNYFTLNIGKVLYRGRNRKLGTNAFKQDQMWSPPKGMSSHGRYNLIGTSVLYCTDKKEGVPLEIHPGYQEVVDVGEFETKSEMILFDMDTTFGNFSGFFNEHDKDPKPLKDVYLLPNYIRDCCSDIGYHGVKYKGVHNELEYTNYAFISYEENKDMVIKQVETNEIRLKYEMVNDKQREYEELMSQF
ncbi:hypothetical protein ABER75_11970 [Niallia taxi]|uniref:hypothetical protein n=1 Tax=Niallia taxi TaxID=2499688 RepID=UPI003D2B75EA